MIIAIEGPDNAGKTTLAQFIAKKARAVYIKCERPARGPDLLTFQSILEKAQEYSGIVIADRHVAISEPIYGPICRGSHELRQSDIDLCIRRLTAVVYCRPPTARIVATISERPQMEGVERNLEDILDAYDKFFAPQDWDSIMPPLVRYDYRTMLPQQVMDSIALADVNRQLKGKQP